MYLFFQSLQNEDGGLATYELTWSYSWLEVAFSRKTKGRRFPGCQPSWYVGVSSQCLSLLLREKVGAKKKRVREERNLKIQGLEES
ncbi:hypothetical protein MTR_6g088110 [Medicago truncatula]|uniref:Uncharacterized protein n=1 Tax=Medicago truncatula TaxID=3880 RepID=G7KPH2_MEDTR|nr:hypothetical protein MTR_6g088110 [Medicago truncatula]